MKLELTQPELDQPLSVSQRLRLLQNLATLLKAGIPILEALEYLTASYDDRPTRNLLENLSYSLASGHRLSSALSSSSLLPHFTPVTRSFIRMGEETGGLMSALEMAAAVLESHDRFIRELRSALAYPVILFISVLGVGAVFVGFLGDRENGLLSTFGDEVPLPTELLLKLSDFVGQPAWLVFYALIGCLSVALFQRFLGGDERIQMSYHRLLLRMPVVGSVVEKSMLARVLFVVSCSLRVGLSVDKSFALAGGTNSNLDFNKRYAQAMRDFRGGKELADCFFDQGIFTKLATSMFKVGFETGRLDAVAESVARLYREEVEIGLRQFTSLVEPIMLCLAGLFATFVALAVLLPVINLSNTL